MSTSKAAWSVLWENAVHVSGPFEISDVVPALAVKIGTDEDEAKRVVTSLLGELARYPDGASFFYVEGYAVVPQPEFYDAVLRSVPPEDAYPFEI